MYILSALSGKQKKQKQKNMVRNFCVKWRYLYLTELYIYSGNFEYNDYVLNSQKKVVYHYFSCSE